MIAQQSSNTNESMEILPQEDNSNFDGVDKFDKMDGLVKIGKRIFATDLHWELASTLAEIEVEAKNRVLESQLNAEFYCIRRGATQQIAFGFKSLNHKVKMPSLAATIADNIGGNWLGIFAINNGFYLLGVVNDGILAETDRFFSDIQDAYTCFHKLYDITTWDCVYAPNKLNIPDAINLDLSNFISKRPTTCLKISTSKKPKTFKVLGFCVMILVVCIVIWYLNPYSVIKKLETENKIVIENSKTQTNLDKFPPKQPLMPWDGKLNGIAVLTSCIQSIEEFPASIPGWSVSELLCDGYSASVRLKRLGNLDAMGGSINWILPNLKNQNYEPKLVIPENGSEDLVEVNWKIEHQPNAISHSIHASIIDIRTALLNEFEERMTPIIFTPTESSEFWFRMGFQFKSPFNPLDFVDIFTAVPGLLISTVHYDAIGGIWTIKGKAYEKRSIPASTVH